MQTFYKICLLLLIVGGVNWGLVGLFFSSTLWAGSWAAAPRCGPASCLRWWAWLPLAAFRNCSAKNRRKNNKTAAALCVQQPFSGYSFSSENIKYFLCGLLVVIHIVPANEVGQGQCLVRAVVACAALVGGLGVHHLAGKFPDGNAVLRQVGLAAAGVGE